MERKILKTITMIDTSVSAGSGWHAHTNLTYHWRPHPSLYLTLLILGLPTLTLIAILLPYIHPLALIAVLVGLLVGGGITVITQDEPRRFPTRWQARRFMAGAADPEARLQLKYWPDEDEFGDIVPRGCTLQCKSAGKIYSLDVENYTIVVDTNCASDWCGLDYTNRTLIVSGS